MSAQSLFLPGNLLMVPTAGLNPKASSGDSPPHLLVSSPTNGFLFIFSEKLSQEAYRSPEPLQMSVSLPAAIAVGFFLTGLLVGVLCSMLLKTQVSVSLGCYQQAGPSHRLKAEMGQNAHNKTLKIREPCG